MTDSSKIMPSAPIPQQSFPSIQVSVHSENIPRSLEPTRVENKSKNNNPLQADEDGDQNGDGYYWSKYAKKLVMGSKHPQIYYKCTQPNCRVKKKVARSHEGHIKEIKLKGVHSHPKPSNDRSIGSSNPLADLLTEESHDFSDGEELRSPKKMLDFLETNYEASNIENSQLDLRTSQNAEVSNGQFFPNGSRRNLLNSAVPFQPSCPKKIYCYQARRQKIRKILTLACERHRLPLAQTWVPCGHHLSHQDSNNNNDDQCAYSTLNFASYAGNLSIFCLHTDVFSNHHLLKGQGIVGEAFATNKSCFWTDATPYCWKEYRYYQFSKRLHGAIAIPAYWSGSIPPGDHTVPDYVLLLFLPLDCTDVEEQKTIVTSLLSLIAQHLCTIAELEQESRFRQGSDIGPMPTIATNHTEFRQSIGSHDLLLLQNENPWEPLVGKSPELSNPNNEKYFETTPNIRHALVVPDAVTCCHGKFSSIVETEASEEIRHTSCPEKTTYLHAAGLRDARSTTGVEHTKEATMAYLYKEPLETHLLEIGSKPVDLHSSIDELLPLLDRLENCLSRVEQSPSESMRNALSPSLKALVTSKLLRHSDDDVRVAVASCFSEIIRITAPDPPYDDAPMEDVFFHIISSFENLSDMTSRSYTKITSILETFANVKSCFLMLDLQCNILCSGMFQCFLEAIRDNHPESVFLSMEKIMTDLILEDSEDESLFELLRPILRSLNNDNKALPVAWKLGERVIQICAAKVKPYLLQAVKDGVISLDDYSKVISTICKDADGDNVEQNEVQASDENMAALSSKTPDIPGPMTLDSTVFCLSEKSTDNEHENPFLESLFCHDDVGESLSLRAEVTLPFHVVEPTTEVANITVDKISHRKTSVDSSQDLDLDVNIMTSAPLPQQSFPNIRHVLVPDAATYCQGEFSSVSVGETSEDVRRTSCQEKPTDLTAAGLEDAGKSTTGGLSNGVKAKKRKGTNGGDSRGEQHPLWQYCSRIEKNSHGVKCNFCEREFQGGGITRFELHLLPDGRNKNVKKCQKITQDEVDEVKVSVKEWRSRKENKKQKTKKTNKQI